MHVDWVNYGPRFTNLPQLLLSACQSCGTADSRWRLCHEHLRNSCSTRAQGGEGVPQLCQNISRCRSLVQPAALRFRPLCDFEPLLLGDCRRPIRWPCRSVEPVVCNASLWDRVVAPKGPVGLVGQVHSAFAGEPVGTGLAQSSMRSAKGATRGARQTGACTSSSRAPSLCPATVPRTPSASLNGICNRQ